MFFPVSGVTAPLWLPPLVGFAISLFTSMVGVSGAFLLLPFQMSVLGYVSPSVSATNLVFNLVAIPSGVSRYAREGRMDWPLARVIAAGTLPGLLAGWWLRVHWLPQPHAFKFFVGVVLAALAVHLLAGFPGRSVVPTVGPAEFPPMRPVFFAALGIGVIGGAYGIGGGSLMAPVLVAVFGLSVHAVAGAALFGTFITSAGGVALYQFLPAPPDMETRPDWALGILFGLGGAVGAYLGARLQIHVAQHVLKLGLALLLGALSATYVIQFFR
ncbi:MAG: sulfite exporter TauE/SafE family protein [Burkholderiales bacterium]